MKMIAVAEANSKANSIIVRVVYAQYRVEWERYSSDAVSIRGMSAVGMPEEMPRDGSGRHRSKAKLAIDISLSHEDRLAL